MNYGQIFFWSKLVSLQWALVQLPLAIHQAVCLETLDSPPSFTFSKSLQTAFTSFVISPAVVPSRRGDDTCFALLVLLYAHPLLPVHCCLGHLMSQGGHRSSFSCSSCLLQSSLTSLLLSHSSTPSPPSTIFISHSVQKCGESQFLMCKAS